MGPFEISAGPEKTKPKPNARNLTSEEVSYISCPLGVIASHGGEDIDGTVLNFIRAEKK